MKASNDGHARASRAGAAESVEALREKRPILVNASGAVAGSDGTAGCGAAVAMGVEVGDGDGVGVPSLRVSGAMVM